MSLEHYICSHCGRRFEAEEKEIVECPECFWTTSVRKEDDERQEPAKEVQPPAPAKTKAGLAFNKRAVGGTLIVLAGIAAFVFLGPRLQKFLFSSFKMTMKSSSPKGVGITAPEREGQVPEGQEGIPVMSEGDRGILERIIPITAERSLTEEEKSILEHQALFQTGWAVKLPSQAWSLQEFGQMVEEQENLYVIRLPRSYKKNLERLFQEKYVAAAAAFQNGELQRARDLWVESLAFPIYANDIQKHRGVALTMLRPFVNDTLSKIAILNITLSERGIREKEELVSRLYKEFLERIGQRSWAEAAVLELELERKVDELQNLQIASLTVPPYPESVRQVDPDIVSTLMDMIEQSSASLSDLTPLRRDIENKKKVIESFIPEKLEVQRERYREAQEMIRNRNWFEAEKRLREIEYPLDIAQDAREKVGVLKRFQQNGS